MRLIIPLKEFSKIHEGECVKILDAPPVGKQYIIKKAYPDENFNCIIEYEIEDLNEQLSSAG